VPTILRFRGFRIVIWTNEHGLPHVHCIGQDVQVSFWLHARTRSVSLRDGATKMKRLDQKALEQFLVDNLDILLKAWSALHDSSK
jgi:hypothetical protein